MMKKKKYFCKSKKKSELKVFLSLNLREQIIQKCIRKSKQKVQCLRHNLTEFKTFWFHRNPVTLLEIT